jgi:hypothetical protein
MTDRPLIERMLIWFEERLADAWEWYEARERRRRRAQVLQDIHDQTEEDDYTVTVQERTETIYTVSKTNAVHIPRRLN